MHVQIGNKPLTVRPLSKSEAEDFAASVAKAALAPPVAAPAQRSASSGAPVSPPRVGDAAAPASARSLTARAAGCASSPGSSAQQGPRNRSAGKGRRCCRQSCCCAERQGALGATLPCPASSQYGGLHHELPPSLSCLPAIVSARRMDIKRHMLTFI